MNTQTTVEKRYQIEIYVDSFENGPSISFGTNNPIPTYSKGDMMRSDTWGGVLGDSYGTTWYITGVKHMIIQIEGEEIRHYVGLTIALSPQPM